jgi:2-polyprenyl-3-methyl-5-hydroxy-6-metoxy-1,4-benzoquinol methylase
MVSKCCSSENDESLNRQQNQCDAGWHSAVAQGKEQRGNLQTNLDFLAETSVLKPGDKILEIGCGIGTIVFELARQGYDVRGTDLSRVAIEYGRSKYKDIQLQVQPAEELGFEDGTFDVVLSFDLFEHIASIDRHVAEVRRVLKPGGCYLFQTPNKWSNIPFEVLRTRSLGWRRYHPSLHTPGQLRRRLNKHGFRVQFVKMNPINEFTLQKIRQVGPLGFIFRHVDFRRLALCLQTNLYVVARHGETDDRSLP